VLFNLTNKFISCFSCCSVVINISLVSWSLCSTTITFLSCSEVLPFNFRLLLPVSGLCPDMPVYYVLAMLASIPLGARAFCSKLGRPCFTHRSHCFYHIVLFSVCMYLVYLCARVSLCPGLMYLGVGSAGPIYILSCGLPLCGFIMPVYWFFRP
jgi:hypothetical protein